MNNICGGGCDKEIDLEQDHVYFLLSLSAASFSTKE
jgi:hypothetical protein